MKKMFGLFVVLALMAVPLSHLLLAVPPGTISKKKVRVCHVTDSQIVEVTTNCCKYSCGPACDALGVIALTTSIGHVISVSLSALPAHLAHGDSLTFVADGDKCRFPSEKCVPGECIP